MAAHSSILDWEIPWTEEPDGYQRVGHDLVTASEAHTLPASDHSPSVGWGNLVRRAELRAGLCVPRGDRARGSRQRLFSRKGGPWSDHLSRGSK